MKSNIFLKCIFLMLVIAISIHIMHSANADDDNYDFLILTTESLAEYFEDLATLHNDPYSPWKADTKVKTIENPTTENVRQFIFSEYQNYNIKYVLIGGDIDIIPVKRFTVSGNDYYLGSWSYSVPTDPHGCLTLGS